MINQRTLVTLLAVTLLLGLATGPVGAAPPQTFSYTVQLGDTLATISRKFGVTADVILDLNGLRTRPHLIYAGEKLTLPITLAAAPSYVNAFLYTVKIGDTVQSLNNTYYIDKFTLRLVNGLPADTNVLTPGVTLLIPAGPHRYTAKSGDTLQSIALMFGQSVNVILKFNAHLKGGASLVPGANVYIPIVYNAPYTPIGGAAATAPGEGFGGGGESTINGVTLNPAAGLKITDSAEAAKAANKNVISAFQALTMPQNVVNLNGNLVVRWAQLRRVRRDLTRENGAIMTVAVQFRGGNGTVGVQHYVTSAAGVVGVKGLPVSGIYVNAGEKELWNDIEVDILATCSAATADHLIVTSGNQTVEFNIEFWVECP